MQAKSTGDREQLWEDLREMTDQRHTLQALNATVLLLPDVRYSATQPTGAVNKLLSAARTPDSDLDEQEIAEILYTPELGADIEVTRHRSTTPAAEDDQWLSVSPSLFS